jgi:hypothetical protein
MARTASWWSIGETLLAARDPRGWRPLVVGSLGDGYVFASETCALDIVGAQLIREVLPGEIIAVDSDGMRSFQAEPSESGASVRLRARVLCASRFSKVFGGSVDRSRRALGRQLAIECNLPRVLNWSSRYRTPPIPPRSATPRNPALPLRTGADSQSLRRANLHPADAGGARRQGEGEVQPGA